ncbi:MAG: PBECR2 nuclease fold domain-containing protein [Candidatus Cloacimonadia bacterium]
MLALPAIDDTLQNPTEIWLDKEGKRLRYMKKYKEGLVILVDVVDGRFDYFNIIPKVRHTTMDRDRNGFYLGR